MALKRALALGLLLSLGLAAGCSKREAPPRRTEPWLASPSASGAVLGGPRAFRFTSDSVIRFSTSGRKGKLSGRLPLAQGELRFDPRDVRGASASLSVDLTKLSIDESPAAAELGGSSPDTLARQWLELGPEVPAERREQFATARFELSSLENLSASFLELTANGKSSGLRATAVGTLLLHGFRAPVRAEVRVSTTRTDQLSIRSVGALVITLAPHDIVARGPAGVVDALGASRSADWVGKQARVEFELIAEAAQRAPK
jgi:hypothetical protein